jgi:hypothetical protein
VLFNGSISGNSTSFTTMASGDYLIDVYLMRNAARRNEKADYSLTIYVEPPPPTAPAPHAQQPAPEPTGAASDANTAELPRLCQTEASARFDVSTRHMRTMPAQRAGQEYIVFGNYDGPNGLVMFRCYYDAAGRFISVN